MSTPRFRQTDNRVLSHYTMSDFNPGSGSPSSVYTSNSGRYKSGKYKSISDVWDPDYFKAKSRGDVVLHPVTIRTEDRFSEDSHWTFGEHPIWGRRTFEGSVACEAHVSPSGVLASAYDSNVDNAKDLALVEAYAKMNSPDVLLSVFYAEREKTAAMLQRPFGKAYDLTKRIANRKLQLISRGYTAARALAQAWLEYRFGWRPVMMDVAGIAKAAGHQKPKTGQLLIKRGGSDLRYLEEQVQDVNFAGLTSLRRAYNWRSTAEVRSGVCYKYRDLSEAEWKMRCLGLTLDQVPSTVWELTPWSFVSDYFVKTGQWLSAITPNPDVVVLGNWVSTKREDVNTTTLINALVHVNNSPATDYNQAGGSYSERLGTFTRQINRNLPATPPMAVKPLSFSQNVDLASLLLGLVHGGLAGLRH